MVLYNAKDAEIYLFTIDDVAGFDPSAKGNDTTYAEYLDAAITAADVSGLTKVSSELTEVDIEPEENEVETTKYFGVTSTGAQNSAVSTTINTDLDISLTSDAQFEENISKFGLAQLSDTHATVTDYAAFNLGSLSTDTIGMFVKIVKKVGSTYYYKNYIIVAPEFLKIGEFTGSSEDTTLTVEYSLKSTKSNGYKDYYNDTSLATYTNF